MEEEHTVPQLTVQAMVALPLVGIPVPRRLALLIGAGLAVAIFLVGQGTLPLELVFQFVLPALAAAGLAYYTIRLEGLSFDRWAAVLWEYVNLPRHVLWRRGQVEAPSAPGARAGVSAGDLWR